jgi:hypothetical protein
MIEQDKRTFTMNLQLFNDDKPVVPIPGYDSLGTDITAMLAAENGEIPIDNPAAPVDLTAPVAAPLDPVAPAAPVEPAPVSPPVVDPMNNPIIQQLIQQNQMLQTSMQQQSEMMQKYMQNSMTNNAPQPSPEVMKTPEEVEAEKEAFMARFYENPMGVLNEHTDRATEPLKKELSAYKEREVWNNEVGTMAANAKDFPEFENVRARMSDILFKEMPQLTQTMDKPQALVTAYKLALAEKTPAQVPAATPMQANPADMMKDPNFINQLISNPEVMKMLAMAQAKNIQNNSQQVPPMSPSSGMTNVAPFIKTKANNYDSLEAEIRNDFQQGMLRKV